MTTSGTLKPRYHILYAQNNRFGDDAEVLGIPCDTMEGVIKNLIGHEICPIDAIIILGWKIDVDETAYETAREARRAQRQAERDAQQDAWERREYERLRTKFEEKS